MPSEYLRMRFSKEGTLRFLSHHDLLRTLERVARRADIPLRWTQGFHPGPRLILALPCPLGAVGRREVLDFDCLSPQEPEPLRLRWNAQSPPGLHFHEAKIRASRATAQVRRAIYRFSWLETPPEDLEHRARELLAQERIWVERDHPTPRRTNIRPYLRGLEVQSDQLCMDLWVTGQGTARGDEILKLLGLHEGLLQGGQFARDDLELTDEIPFGPGDAGPPDQPPQGPPEIELRHEPTQGTPKTTLDSALPSWGLSPHGPVVE